MKQLNWTNILYYVLAAVSVFVISRPVSCVGNRNAEVIEQANNFIDSLKANPVILKDTVYEVKYLDRIVTTVRVDTIRVRDEVIVYKPTETIVTVRDTAVMILFDEGDMAAMKLYEGSIQGDNCLYDYMAGFGNDSLQFLHIASDCPAKVQYTATIKEKTPFHLGVTGRVIAGITEPTAYGVGASFIWRNALFGVEYSEREKLSYQIGYSLSPFKSKNEYIGVTGRYIPFLDNAYGIGLNYRRSVFMVGGEYQPTIKNYTFQAGILLPFNQNKK